MWIWNTSTIMALLFIAFIIIAVITLYIYVCIHDTTKENVVTNDTELEYHATIHIYCVLDNVDDLIQRGKIGSATKYLVDGLSILNKEDTISAIEIARLKKSTSQFKDRWNHVIDMHDIYTGQKWIRKT